MSEVEDECELLLTAESYLHKFTDHFMWSWWDVHPGFTLENGECNCDCTLHTDDIDQQAIHHPANTWNTHNNSNTTKYLVTSNYPVDYCLPHSSSWFTQFWFTVSV